MQIPPLPFYNAFFRENLELPPFSRPTFSVRSLRKCGVLAEHFLLEKKVSGRGKCGGKRGVCARRERPYSAAETAHITRRYLASVESVSINQN